MIEKLEAELKMLERHLLVLRIVIDKKPIGIVAMSNTTGLPEHKIRYSLRVLEKRGLIEPTPRGAVPTEELNEFFENHDDRIDDIVKKVETMRFSQGVVA